VNKDYVSLAISTLDKKDASPELRKWSVDVLSKLSPVPFGNKLREELTTSGLYRQKIVFSRVEPPRVLLARCHSLIPKSIRSISVQLAQRVTNAYEECRIKHDSLVELLADYNQIIDKANAEEAKIDAEFRKSVGLPAEVPSVTPNK
jgi:hypothetical protein